MKLASLVSRILWFQSIALIACPPVLADIIGRDPAVRAETDESLRWWGDGVVLHGMLSFTWPYASDSGGPSSNGPRISYGNLGIGDDGPGWVEFWLASRSSENLKLISTGVTLAPTSYNYRRMALAWLFDVGFERRVDEERIVVAGLLGVGGEFVVRLFRHWDMTVAVEQYYRTTVDFESQVRCGIRFHDEHIAPW